MPPQGHWLSLRVSDKKISQGHADKHALLISIPKKNVRLATQRNRLKRLLREAVRGDDFFKDPGKVYHFKIGSPPRGLKLRDVLGSLETLKKEL